MQRRTFIKHTGKTGLLVFANASLESLKSESETLSQIEQEFLKPPAVFYPQVFWFWMNGNVTKEGITQDLEEMKEVGVGGVFNFDVGTGIPKGPVEYLSDEWLALKKHALSEAERLGLEFTMHNCPGWSSSGGPWITPELSMKQITWSEAYVAGGKTIKRLLPKPASRLNYYNDIAVIAFPSLKYESLLQNIKASSSSGFIETKFLNGEDANGIVVTSAENENAFLQIEFDQPFLARSISFFIGAINTGDQNILHPEFSERTYITLEASVDGTNFYLVTKINTGLEGDLLLSDKFITYDIPETNAKYFRLSSKQTRRYKQVQFSGITKLKNWMEKGNHRGAYVLNVGEDFGLPDYESQEDPKGCVIDVNSIVDVTKKMDATGVLEWNAPEGNWTILRIGFTSTGATNKAAPDTGIGLECDKFNSNAFEFHFKKMMERLYPFIEHLTATGNFGLEIDSYEAGSQNWTDDFENLFLKKWKYDLLKYLPAVAGGRVVGSVATTEKFLWNFRRLQADLIADNYYGRFNELCHQYNIISYTEPYDQGPMEEMQIGSRVDINMGEFWNGYSSSLPIKHPVKRTLKLASSIAHINGKNLVGAEAFTSEPDSARWQEYPFAIKALGDAAFVDGVNKMIIHRFVHQPNIYALPGMTMGPWGIHFDRTTTWWKQSKSWLQYLSRGQCLLTKGKTVADILYFTGENANLYTKANKDQLQPKPPEGYNYDLINAEAIFKKVEIADKKIKLKSGAQYHILVLQNYKAISLELLTLIKGLVQKGMQLYGTRPLYTIGLESDTDADIAFKKITNELWGDINENSVTGNKFGEGTVFSGIPLKSVLQKLNVEKDFEFTSRSMDAPILYHHKKVDDTDIYFVCNKRRSVEDIVCTFRIDHKQPEKWDAVTGKIISINVYETLENKIRIPLQLQPCGSIFIVFRKQTKINSIHAVIRNDAPLFETKNFKEHSRRLFKDVTNNFSISFWAKPEINILLYPKIITGTLTKIWTEYYAVYPTQGNKLYGDGHATCGLTVGRNGIAVWESSNHDPELVLSADHPLSGWTHVVLIYKNGKPSIYINGGFLKEGTTSKYIIHPGIGEAFLNEGASYYNGDMTRAELHKEILSNDAIEKLASKLSNHLPEYNAVTETQDENKRSSLLIKENGNYKLIYSNRKTFQFKITDIINPIEIKSPWQVNFPIGYGTSSQIMLEKLISLHKHKNEDVKYFSGTATYINTFIFSQTLAKNTKVFLNLGEVEVIAEVIINGYNLGILWTRPYSVDITNALRNGENKIEIKVTNQWVNRLIGDEQHATNYSYTPGGGESGGDGIIGGAIEKLPDWYMKNLPKPNDGRITFSTWQHYKKDSPLLQSGLIGPVVLHFATIKNIDL